MELKECGSTKIVKVYEESAHCWLKIGQNLGLENGILTSIKHNFSEDYERVTKVFQKWLENAVKLPNFSRYPRTWRGLVNLLTDSDLGNLAHKVDTAVIASAANTST